MFLQCQLSFLYSLEQFVCVSHIVIFTGVFQASAEDGTVRLQLSWFRQLCRRLYLIDTLLVLLSRTRNVLFCVCKVSLQSFDIMPPKSLLSIIIIQLLQIWLSWSAVWWFTCTCSLFASAAVWTPCWQLYHLLKIFHCQSVLSAESLLDSFQLIVHSK